MKENTTKKKSAKIANIVFWVVLGLVAIYSVLALVSTDDNTMTIFGRTAFTVQTDSMKPTFEKGDMIYVDTDFNVDDIKVGDVISYYALIDVDGDNESELVINSHRVSSIETDINGNLHFVTKGDNNNSVDEGTVHDVHVIGIWTGDSVKNLGGIIDGLVSFLKSGTGFFIFIVIPTFSFLIFQTIKFVGVMSEYKKQEALKDAKIQITEEAIAAARAQLEEEARLKALEVEKEKD